MGRSTDLFPPKTREPDRVLQKDLQSPHSPRAGFML